jgi:hypothetical protein
MVACSYSVGSVINIAFTFSDGPADDLSLLIAFKKRFIIRLS